MLIGDKGYDSDAFRKVLAWHGITPRIPPRTKRRAPAAYCETLYRQCPSVENMFAKLKDWRRISTRYDRCAYTHLHLRKRNLLALIMSPEPSLTRDGFDREVRELSAQSVKDWNARFLGHLEEIAAVHAMREPVDLVTLANMLSCNVDGAIIMSKVLKNPGELERQVLA